MNHQDTELKKLIYEKQFEKAYHQCINDIDNEIDVDYAKSVLPDLKDIFVRHLQDRDDLEGLKVLVKVFLKILGWIVVIGIGVAAEINPISGIAGAILSILVLYIVSLLQHKETASFSISTDGVKDFSPELLVKILNRRYPNLTVKQEESDVIIKGYKISVSEQSLRLPSAKGKDDFVKMLFNCLSDDIQKLRVGNNFLENCDTFWQDIEPLRSEEPVKTKGKTPFSKLFVRSGRIPAAEYWISVVCAVLGLYFVFSNYYDSYYIDHARPKYLPYYFIWLSSLIFFGSIILFQGAKRCHDFGKSGGHQFLIFSFLPKLFFRKGENVPNEYGYPTEGFSGNTGTLIKNVIENDSSKKNIISAVIFFVSMLTVPLSIANKYHSEERAIQEEEKKNEEKEDVYAHCMELAKKDNPNVNLIEKIIDNNYLSDKQKLEIYTALFYSCSKKSEYITKELENILHNINYYEVKEETPDSLSTYIKFYEFARKGVIEKINESIENNILDNKEKIDKHLASLKHVDGYQRDRLLLLANRKRISQKSYLLRLSGFEQAYDKYTKQIEDKIQEEYKKYKIRISIRAGKDEVFEGFTINHGSIDMIFVKGGKCVIDGKEINVEPFYVAEKEVDTYLWKLVMNKEFKWANYQGVAGELTLKECQQFVSRLNSKTGKKFHIPSAAECSLCKTNIFKVDKYERTFRTILDKNDNYQQLRVVLPATEIISAAKLKQYPYVKAETGGKK